MVVIVMTLKFLIYYYLFSTVLARMVIIVVFLKRAFDPYKLIKTLS